MSDFNNEVSFTLPARTTADNIYDIQTYYTRRSLNLFFLNNANKKSVSLSKLKKDSIKSVNQADSQKIFVRVTIDIWRSRESLSLNRRSENKRFVEKHFHLFSIFAASQSSACEGQFSLYKQKTKNLKRENRIKP